MFCVLSQPLVFMSTELFGVAHKQPEFRQAVHAADALLTNWGESWYRGSDGFAADVIAFQKINYSGLHGGNYKDIVRGVFHQEMRAIGGAITDFFGLKTAVRLHRAS